MSIARRLFALAALSVPLILHWSIVNGHLGASAMLSLVLLATLLLPNLSIALRVVLLAFCVALVLVILKSDVAAFSLTVLWTTIVYLSMAAVFGRTLLPGREALITRIARFDQGGELNEDLRAYSRRVTQVWTGFFIGAAAVSVLLAAYESPTVYSLFTNVLCFVLMFVLYAGEYLYRRVRFKQYAHSTPWRLARDIVRRAPELLR